MAYNNAIYYIDLVNGNDAARTALTGCNFINNGAGVVRMFKAAHGLITGSVILVPTGTYSGSWLVNKIDNDNVDLFSNRAVGNVTRALGVTPAVNDTLTIGSNVFTFKAARSAAFEITIDEDNYQLFMNMVIAINTDQTEVIATYGNLEIKIMSVLSGTIGNDYALATNSLAFTLSGSTLASGANCVYTANRSSVSVTPHGGQSWADAWKTINTGATAARLSPGDSLFFARTPEPVSIGSATWTDGGHVVELASAQTQTIDNCETTWTGTANVTASATTTSYKQGTKACQFVLASAFTTGKIAYKTLPATLDLNAFGKLNFWFRSSQAIIANQYRVVLCSDSNGDVIVDTFIVPAKPSQNVLCPMVLSRVGGGNLGNAINSIAIYADIDPGTPTLGIDAIFTSTASGINLLSLICKNQKSWDDTEPWLPIQSIDGTSVYIDNTSNNQSSEHAVYSGVSETTETYIRETFKTDAVASSTTVTWQTQKAGIAGLHIQYLGGFEVETNIPNGLTYIDGMDRLGFGLNWSAANYTRMSGFGMCRYYNAFQVLGGFQDLCVPQSTSNQFHAVFLNGCANSIFRFGSICNNGYGITFTSNCLRALVLKIVNLNCHNNMGALEFSNSPDCRILEIVNMNRNYYGLAVSGDFIKIEIIRNLNYSTQYGIYVSQTKNTTINEITNLNNNVNGIMLSRCFDTSLKKIIAANNNTNYVISLSDCYACKFRVVSSTGGTKGITTNNGVHYLVDSTFNQATECEVTGQYSAGYIFSINHDAILGNNKIYTFGGVINWQADTKHLSEPGAWKTSVESLHRHIEHPIRVKIAEVAFEADLEVNVKAWVKKDHASNVGCRLVAPENSSVGIIETSDTKANDTDWQQLSISFTPTEMGVTEIWFESWYVAGVSNTYVGTIAVTQA